MTYLGSYPDSIPSVQRVMNALAVRGEQGMRSWPEGRLTEHDVERFLELLHVVMTQWIPSTVDPKAVRIEYVHPLPHGMPPSDHRRRQVEQIRLVHGDIDIATWMQAQWPSVSVRFERPQTPDEAHARDALIDEFMAANWIVTSAGTKPRPDVDVELWADMPMYLRPSHVAVAWAPLEAIMALVSDGTFHERMMEDGTVARENPRAPAGTPTDTNLYALSQFFGDEVTRPNAVEAVDAPHIRRCIKAGLVAATREALTLTDAGVEALATWRAQRVRQNPDDGGLAELEARVAAAEAGEGEGEAKRKGPAPGSVVKKLDEGMWQHVLEAKAAPDAFTESEVTDKLGRKRTVKKPSAGSAQAAIWKRYQRYARRFAVDVLARNLSSEGRSKASLVPIANEVADDALERLLFGKGRSRPAIERFQVERSSLATFIGNIIQHVAMENYRRWKREHGDEGGRARGAPAAEDVASDDEQMSPEEIASQRQSERELKSLAREQGDLVAAGFEQLSEAEASILRLRSQGMSYKAIAEQLFPGEDQKKAVQKVMVRLYRARKRLEQTSGVPLEGLVGTLGDRLRRDRRGGGRHAGTRRNPEVALDDETVLYFETVADLEDLLWCGVLEPASYRACFDALVAAGGV